MEARLCQPLADSTPLPPKPYHRLHHEENPPTSSQAKARALSEVNTWGMQGSSTDFRAKLIVASCQIISLLSIFIDGGKARFLKLAIAFTSGKLHVLCSCSKFFANWMLSLFGSEQWLVRGLHVTLESPFWLHGEKSLNIPYSSRVLLDASTTLISYPR